MHFRSLSALFLTIKYSFSPISNSRNFLSTMSSSRLPAARRNGAELVRCFTDQYDSLFKEKVSRLRGLLKDFVAEDATIEQYESPKTHFRMRANFNIWRDNGKDIKSNNWYYAMFEEGDNGSPCEIEAFPRGTILMNELMIKLKEHINSVPALYEFLFEARFLTTQLGEACIVLIYKKPLPSTWKAHAEVLATQLGVKIVGRSRKVKEIAGGEEHIKETLTVHGKQFHYYHVEGAFSQPNAKVCERMLEWAVDKTANSLDQDLVELYCGGGTFTIAMAQNFNRVLATEMSRQSVELANLAISANGTPNIKIARCSAEEFSEAHKTRRNLHRFTEAGIDITKYNTRTVFVDPPRAGVDPDTRKLLALFDRIVYVSCNPETLARDLGSLTLTHDVIHVAAFDQFPYTHHLESGVVLVKKVLSDASADVTEGNTVNDDARVPDAERAAVDDTIGQIPAVTSEGSVLGKRKSDEN